MVSSSETPSRTSTAALFQGGPVQTGKAAGLQKRVDSMKPMIARPRFGTRPASTRSSTEPASLSSS
jgi:hypothetical protein